MNCTVGEEKWCTNSSVEVNSLQLMLSITRNIGATIRVLFLKLVILKKQADITKLWVHGGQGGLMISIMQEDNGEWIKEGVRDRELIVVVISTEYMESRLSICQGGASNLPWFKCSIKILIFKQTVFTCGKYFQTMTSSLLTSPVGRSQAR